MDRFDLIKPQLQSIFKIPSTWRFVCVPISSSKIRFLFRKIPLQDEIPQHTISKIYSKIFSFADRKDPYIDYFLTPKMRGFFSHFVDLSWLIEFVQSREKVSQLEFSSAKRKRKMHIVTWKICFQIRYSLIRSTKKRTWSIVLSFESHFIFDKKLLSMEHVIRKAIHLINPLCTSCTIWNLISILLDERLSFSSRHFPSIVSVSMFSSN